MTIDEIYLDFVHNFVTVKDYAEYYNITVKAAINIINLARTLHTINDNRKDNTL